METHHSSPNHQSLLYNLKQTQSSLLLIEVLEDAGSLDHAKHDQETFNGAQQCNLNQETTSIDNRHS